MDGERQHNPDAERKHERVEPLTREILIRSAISQFFSTEVHSVEGQRVFYQPSDAVKDVLANQITEHKGRTHREIFLAIQPKTAITPHRFTEHSLLTGIIDPEDNWKTVFEKIEGLPRAHAEALYEEINNFVIVNELNDPSNFPDTGEHTFYNFSQELAKRNPNED